MAGAVASGLLNIVSGAFGIIGFASFATEFVPKPDPSVTVVSISVGQDTVPNDPAKMAGNIPSIRVFAIDGRPIGFDSGNYKKSWAAGSINPVFLKNNKGVENVPAEYLAVYATGTDAICISAVGLRNPTSNTVFGWVADVGQICGMDWHWSETIVGSTGQTGTDAYRPNCVWISGLNSQNDIKISGISTHVIDFSAATQGRINQYNSDNDLMCASAPRFSAWTTIISDISPPFFIPALEYGINGIDPDPAAVHVPGVDLTNYNVVAAGLDGTTVRPVRFSRPGPAIPTRRNELKLTKRGRAFNSTLISSHHPEHSAKQLCESETSYGADAISVIEGLFCDMETKTLWPLCLNDKQKSCFDTSSNIIRGGSAKRTVVPEKRYETIKNWGTP